MRTMNGDSSSHPRPCWQGDGWMMDRQVRLKATESSQASPPAERFMPLPRDSQRGLLQPTPRSCHCHGTVRRGGSCSPHQGHACPSSRALKLYSAGFTGVREMWTSHPCQGLCFHSLAAGQGAEQRSLGWYTGLCEAWSCCGMAHRPGYPLTWRDRALACLAVICCS